MNISGLNKALCSNASSIEGQGHDLSQTAVEQARTGMVRRTGELMELFKSPGARTDRPIDGDVNRLNEPTSMADVASKAGLSERQRNTASAAAQSGFNRPRV